MCHSVRAVAPPPSREPHVTLGCVLEEGRRSYLSSAVKNGKVVVKLDTQRRGEKWILTSVSATCLDGGGGGGQICYVLNRKAHTRKYSYRHVLQDRKQFILVILLDISILISMHFLFII